MLHSLEQLSPLVRHCQLTDGQDHWDYAALCKAVDAWRQHFDAQQVNVIAVEVANSLEWVAVALAILESKRIAVPVPGFFSAQQKHHVLTTSGAEYSITDLPAAAEVPANSTASQEIRTLMGHSLNANTLALPPSTALVSYTSGSTGQPKGVCLSAAHLLATAQAIVTQVSPIGIKRHLCTLPLSLLLENVAGLFANLLNGSEVHLPNLTSLGMQGSSDLDIQRFIAGLHTHQPDSLILVPGQLLGLVAAAEWGVKLPSSIRFIAVGGGKVAPSLLKRAARLELPVFEGYGLTECGSVVALNTPGAVRPGSVGRLLPHVAATLVDNELIVKHPTMLGYVGTTTNKTSTLGLGPEPVATGDLMSIDSEGFVQVQGRRKNTCVTAYGRNLAPEWIEAELTSEVAIAQAVVFADRAVQPVALLVLRDGFSENDMATAVQQVNERLPDYAQIDAWQSLTQGDLEACHGLTPNGRTRRANIQQAYQDQIADLHQQHAQESLHG